MKKQKWVFQTINSRLFSKFLSEVIKIDHVFEFYVDPELKPNKIIVKEQFIQVLKKEFASLYFIKSKVDSRVGEMSPYLDLDQFLKYKKNIGNITIKQNSLVRFTADGQVYMVDSIDLQKNKCVITKVGVVQKITLKVPLDMVVPTIKEGYR